MAKKAEVRPSVIRCPVLCFVCVSADFPNLRIGRGLSFQSLPTLLPPVLPVIFIFSQPSLFGDSVTIFLVKPCDHR
jgi:hypothetical protein